MFNFKINLHFGIMLGIRKKKQREKKRRKKNQLIRK